MKFIIFSFFIILLLGLVFSQTCQKPATLMVRADNFVSVTLIHNGISGTTNVLSEAPDVYQWNNTYTVNFASLDQGDKIKISVTNVGSVGGMKASLSFDGLFINSFAGNPDFSVNCPQSSGISSCTSNGFFDAVDYASTSSSYYGPGTDILPAAAKWIWTGADGFNPEYGVVVFDISINCEPIVQITVCNYEYWEYLALGYPWYHRASLDAWCGAYPSVAGHVTNCYNGAQKIAPACIESFPDFANILAGQVGTVDWNKRCFLHCI